MLVLNGGREVLAHRAVWVIPVPETDAVVARVSTKIDDDAHKEQANEGDDLDAAEPEFEFSEHTDTQEVHRENRNAISEQRNRACREADLLKAIKMTEQQ